MLIQSSGLVTAKALDGNSVEIDQALVDAARSELDVENAWSDVMVLRDQLLLQLTGRSSSTKS